MRTLLVFQVFDKNNEKPKNKDEFISSISYRASELLSGGPVMHVHFIVEHDNNDIEIFGYYFNRLTVGKNFLLEKEEDYWNSSYYYHEVNLTRDHLLALQLKTEGMPQGVSSVLFGTSKPNYICSTWAAEALGISKIIGISPQVLFNHVVLNKKTNFLRIRLVIRLIRYIPFAIYFIAYYYTAVILRKVFGVKTYF